MRGTTHIASSSKGFNVFFFGLDYKARMPITMSNT